MFTCYFVLNMLPELVKLGKRDRYYTRIGFQNVKL
jgi:hypothetical protein